MFFFEASNSCVSSGLLEKESPFFITADDVNEVIRAFFMMKANAQKSEGDLAI